jgi:prepilin signal peptidase PulO-like enzyme (type II secretory pathway)
MTATDALVLSAPLAAVAVAAAWDWRHRAIPDAIPLALLGASLLATATGASAVSWLGLAAGLGIGALLGLGGFQLAVLGGGDAKLLMALGASLGPAGLTGTLVYAAPWLALLAWRARRRGERELPFAPSLALGGGALLVPGA